MDPQQTLTFMLDALEEKRREDAKELADALHEWLVKGGFPPTTLGDSSLGKEWHRAIATFACLAAASTVEDILKRRQRRKAKTTTKGDK
ncbi:MAG TPA: hypothetical protein PLR25_28095 [Planctomycetaceae bacterium]|nr:hypothetical protein [Planctomycetaceae bacterium]